jgi:hypothetical protein
MKWEQGRRIVKAATCRYVQDMEFLIQKCSFPHQITPHIVAKVYIYIYIYICIKVAENELSKPQLSVCLCVHVHVYFWGESSFPFSFDNF